MWVLVENLRGRMAFLHRMRRVWHRLELWWKHYEWFVFGGVLIATVVLGILGFRRHPLARAEGWSWSDILYRSLQLFVMESGAVARPVGLELDIARILAPVAGSYLLIRTLATVFRNQLQLINLRLFTKNHVIVCGLGRRGWAFVKGLTEQGWKVVVIEKDSDNSLVALCREHGAAVIVGDATKTDILRAAGITKARYLIAVTNGDETNITIQDNARQLRQGVSNGKLICILHILDPHVCQRLSWSVFVGQASDNLIVDFFSIYRTGTQHLLEEYPPFQQKQGRKAKPPCVLVVGAGSFAQGLIERLGRQWWLQKRPEIVPFKVLMVAAGASQVRSELLLRNRQLGRICDLRAYDFSPTSAAFQQGKFLFDENGNCEVTKAYVCAEEGADSVSGALALNEILESFPVEVVTVVEHGTSHTNLKTFAWLDRICGDGILPDCKVELIARALHKSFIAQSKDDGWTVETKPSMAEWDELDEEFKDSSRQAAGYAEPRLKMIGCQVVPLTDWDADLFRFTGPELEFLAEKEHERWVDEREAKGWTLGDRDLGRKKSPHLRPWSELEEGVREYDRRQVDILPEVLAGVDLQIDRVHYEMLAMRLHQGCLSGEPLLGESREDYGQYPWDKLGEASCNWYRDKADLIVKHLQTLCYRLDAPEEGDPKPSALSPEETDLLCDLMNPGGIGSGAMGIAFQRKAVDQLLNILQELGYELKEDPYEILARALHEQYLKDHGKRVEDLRKAGIEPPKDPLAVPWHELPKIRRDMSREAALHIPVKLAALGYGMKHVPSRALGTVKLDDDEIEVMARMEHERWFREQGGMGWTHAPGGEDAWRRTTPRMVPWPQLEDNLRKGYRDSVRIIPQILTNAGFEVYDLDAARRR